MGREALARFQKTVRLGSGSGFQLETSDRLHLRDGSEHQGH